MAEKSKNGKLVAPYGGTLVNLIVTGEEREELLARSNRLAFGPNFRTCALRSGTSGIRALSRRWIASWARPITSVY